MDHIPNVGQQQIGHPAGIDRGAHHRQILRAEGQGLLPGLGQVEAAGLIPGPQPLRGSFARVVTTFSVVPVPLK